MYSRGSNIFSILMAAVIAVVVAMVFFQRRQDRSMMQLPARSLRKGSRMIRAGTRGVVNGAKQGLRVLSR